MLQTGSQSDLDHWAMSPIFPCRGCGTFIERSTQHYRRVKGVVLCSTCLDAQVESKSTAGESLFGIFSRLRLRLWRSVEGWLQNLFVAIGRTFKGRYQ